MAQLKNTVISGSLRATDTISALTAQFKILKIPDGSSSTNYTTGTNGYIIKTNGTNVYWDSANNHTHNYAGSSSAGGATILATTTADTSNALYPVGVTSGATTTLKRDTSITMAGGVIKASVLQLDQGNAADPSLTNNARIQFNYSDGQPVVISYTPNDSYRAPAGLKVMGGASATPAWFEVEGNIYATAFKGNADTATAFSANKTVELTGDVTGSASSTGGWSIATTIGAGKVTNNMLAGSIANGKLSNSKVTIAGTDVSLGGSITADTLRTSLGLSNAMHFLGVTTTNVSTGTPNTTATVTIGSSNVTAAAGDVVLYGSQEYVWGNSKWNLLGDESSYKVKQTAQSDPTASTTTSTTFIDTISQDANGVITATKKTLPTASNSVAGITKVGASGGAAAYEHTHTLSLTTDSGTSSISLAANTKYKLTAGGSTYVFTTPSDTNTWRGIQDNLTSSTNTTESLSAKQGYLLANGSARDSTKVTKISSSTDNAIVRFDGTSGQVQNSTAILTDDGGITLTHQAGKQKELEIVYSTTVDFSLMVGTGNENHGLYDYKKGSSGSWILSAGTDNNWTFYGNAATATTASKLSNTYAIGGTDRPVYFTNGGVPAQTTYRMVGTNATATTGLTYSNNLDTGIWFVSGITAADNPSNPGGATYGVIYAEKYNDNWIHEIYGDYKTGQIAVRGKDNGTWQDWRKILDSVNYKNYLNDGIASNSTELAATANSALIAASKTASSNNTLRLYLTGARTQASTGVDSYSYQYTYTENGLLSALKVGLNLEGTEKAHMEWNNTDQTIDFVFA